MWDLSVIGIPDYFLIFVEMHFKYFPNFIGLIRSGILNSHIESLTGSRDCEPTPYMWMRSYVLGPVPISLEGVNRIHWIAGYWNWRIPARNYHEATELNSSSRSDCSVLSVMSSSRVSCLIQRLYAFDTMPLNSPRRKAIKETLYRLEEVYDSASRNI